MAHLSKYQHPAKKGAFPNLRLPILEDMLHVKHSTADNKGLASPEDGN